MQLVQKFIVEEAAKASPILPQRVALVGSDGKTPALTAATKTSPGMVKQAAKVADSATMADLVAALVAAGIMAAK